MTSTSIKRANSISADDEPSTATNNVLEVEGLQTVFHTQDGKVHAVNDVSFSLEAGELLGIVGESGSGKSVTMMSLLKLLPMPPAEIVAGKVMFGGRDLLKLDLEELRDVRGGDIGFIFLIEENVWTYSMSKIPNRVAAAATHRWTIMVARFLQPVKGGVDFRVQWFAPCALSI